MKKIILSVAVATMAFSTTASALEDIKVNGQAKLWYESNDKGDGLLNKDQASGETVMKIGVTGKQGDVSFGTAIYQTSTMGLEGLVVNGTRTSTAHAATSTDGSPDMYVGEAYVVAPVGGSTILKYGMQELDTPLLFTERWNATPITYNGAVAINNSIDNLTVIGAYVGQVSNSGTRVSDYAGYVDGSNPTPTSTAGWVSSGTPANQINSDGAFALGGLYKAEALDVNAWYYTLPTLADALWIDAGMKMGDAGVKAYVASMMPSYDGGEATTAIALCANYKVAGWTLSGAFSSVGEGDLPVGNVGTNSKKTKLPTAGVYTDGLYVAQPEATAMKVKAAGSVGDTKLIVQAVNSTNASATLGDTKDTTEIDVIAIQKVGDFNVKAILMNRTFANTTANTDAMYLRAIVSLDF